MSNEETEETHEPQPPAKITLSHPDQEDVVLEFDVLAMRNNKWMERVLFLPWTTPHRTIGFIHPAAEVDLGVRPVRLFAAFAYLASIGTQPVGPDRMRVVKGPTAVLPVDLVAPLDMVINSTCPSWVFLRDQGDAWKEMFGEMLKKQLCGDSQIAVVPPEAMPPPPRT